MTQTESMTTNSIEDAHTEERKKLERVIHRIKAKQIRVEKLGHTPAADRSAAAALRAQFEKDQNDLTSALEQLYFGRIDFENISIADSASKNSVVYIGSHEILEENVCVMISNMGNTPVSVEGL